MNSAPTSDQILSLENKYWEAMKNNDIESAVSMTKFPCVLTSPRGVLSVSEGKYREMMGAFQGEQYRGIELQNPQVEILNAETALISYTIEHEGKKMLDVSTWVRDGENWVCAYHSENPLQ